MHMITLLTLLFLTCSYSYFISLLLFITWNSLSQDKSFDDYPPRKREGKNCTLCEHRRGSVANVLLQANLWILPKKDQENLEVKLFTLGGTRGLKTTASVALLTHPLISLPIFDGTLKAYSCWAEKPA